MWNLQHWNFLLFFPKCLITLNWGKHLLSPIAHFCKGSASASGQGSLGHVVPVPCAERGWLGTHVLCT